MLLIYLDPYSPAAKLLSREQRGSRAGKGVNDNQAALHLADHPLHEFERLRMRMFVVFLRYTTQQVTFFVAVVDAVMMDCLINRSAGGV